MKPQTLKYLLVFTGLPLLLWALGEYHRDTILKEFLSVITILAFCLMIGQFFLARGNRKSFKGIKMSKVVKFHKLIGYVFVGVLLIHPLLIVVSRFFEAGIEPKEAFITMLTTFDSLGVVLGIIAWVLMLLLGLMSIFREKIGLSYRAWRWIHGVLSIAFISIACWHVVDLGRHINTSLAIFLIAFTAAGVILLLRTYVLENKPKKKRIRNNTPTASHHKKLYLVKN